MKKLILLIITCSIFNSCEKNTEKDFDQLEKLNKDIIINQKPVSLDSSFTQPLLNHYLAIGYFNEENNLINIDRFINGELIISKVNSGI